MTLRLPPEIHARALALAREALGLERCAALFSRADDADLVVELVPIPNVAAEPARAFELDGLALLRALRDGEARGLALRGLLHTHPSGGVGLSPHDVDGALWDGAPRFPGASLLVVAIEAGVARVASYAFDDVARAFVDERVDRAG